MPIYRLGWYDNADRLDVAVLANRLVAAGHAVSRAQEPSGTAEAGDYLIDVPETLATALAGRLRAGGMGGVIHADSTPSAAGRCSSCLSGKASAIRITATARTDVGAPRHRLPAGFGRSIANGALDGDRYPILPGGFELEPRC